MSVFATMSTVDVQTYYQTVKQRRDILELQLRAYNEPEDSELRLSILMECNVQSERALAASLELLRRWEPAVSRKQVA